jgi:chaperonin cofactor prefoldin
MSAIEANQIKVLATKSWLLEIIKNPSKFNGNSTLNMALRSQSGMAKLVDNDRGIVSCSLNTLKSNSESLLERGFIELDELRINAKKLIDGLVITNQSGKSTRSEMKNRICEIEVKLDNLRKSNFLLSTMVAELRGELKNMVFSNANLEQKKHIYNEINKRVEVKLSFCFNGGS